MSLRHRADGDLVRDVVDLRRIMPYVMRTRTGSAVYFEQTLDVGKAERFVKDFNEAHPELRASVFHVIVWAVREALTEFPNMNRFVAGGRLYQRRGMWISYSAKQRLRTGSPLVVLKRDFPAHESFARMVEAMQSELHDVRFGGRTGNVDSELKAILALPGLGRRAAFAAYRGLEALGVLPRWFIESDPLYASVFLTDLGSLRMEPAFHHLYEYGTISVFGAIGRRYETWRPDPRTGEMRRHREATVRWSFDERVEDGLYGGYSLRHAKHLVEDPVAHGIAEGDEQYAVSAAADH